MSDCVRGIASGGAVIRWQQFSQRYFAFNRVTISEHPPSIGCERALFCSCGKLERGSVSFSRLVSKFGQRFRRVQPIRASGVQKSGEDFTDPLLALLIGPRRLGED